MIAPPTRSEPPAEPRAGLTEAQAIARLTEEGRNQLPAQKRRNLFDIVLEVLREPMFLMLVAAGSLYLMMGETSDALMLLGFVFVVMAITIVQERRTERSLTALRDLSSPRALVIRESVRRRIAGEEVARGDFVVLNEGDRVPADGLVRSAVSLCLDESLLSGESSPVRKAPSIVAQALDRPGGDELASVFSGTLVTAGEGVVEILATGTRTELGKIGRSLAEITPEPTRLQLETRRVVRILAAVAVVACVGVVFTFALTRGGSASMWKEGFLAGIALAMALLPDEFPVVLTIFLALGAWRLSRSHVLTRRMPAIELLGTATVLCVDKTGTLTQNKMTLRALTKEGVTTDLLAAESHLPPSFHPLLADAILASKPAPFDPMERALTLAGDQLLEPNERIHPGWSLLREYPLTRTLMAVSYAWGAGTDEVVVTSKGAPEAIAQLCHLDAQQRALLASQVTGLAAGGLRVLAVARTVTRGPLPAEHGALSLELVGLVGFEDPLRATVPKSVAECEAAGIRVVMVTGDAPATAQSVARSAGLARCEVVITGAELETLSDEALAQKVGHVQVFARVLPEHKLRIVNALKANGEVVAMTGDCAFRRSWSAVPAIVIRGEAREAGSVGRFLLSS